MAIFVTKNYIILCHMNTLKQEWFLHFKDLQTIKMDRTGISLVQTNVNGAISRTITCPDVKTRDWIKNQIEEAFTNFIQTFKSAE
jgi:hypothetical protein